MAATRRKRSRKANNKRKWKKKSPHAETKFVDESGNTSVSVRKLKNIKDNNVGNYEERIQRLKSEINALVREIYSCLVDSSKKDKEVSKLQSRIHILVSELENALTQNTTYCTQLQYIRQENIVALKRAKHFENQLEKLEKSYKDTKDKAKQLQQDKHLLEVEVRKIATKHKLTEDELFEKSKKLKTDLEEKKYLLKMKDQVLGKRPKPLRNLGSTCFMNAMLQNLAWTPKLGNELQKQLTDMHGITTADEYDLTLSVFHLVCYTQNDNMAHSSSSVPRRMLQAARKKNDIFDGYQQQDSFEMFNTIVNGMKDELLPFYKESVGDSKAHMKDDDILRRHGAVRLFSGKFITVYKYSSCSHVESVFQSFTSITVPIVKEHFKNKYTEALADYKLDNEGNRKKKKGKQTDRNKSSSHEFKTSRFYQECCSDPKCKNRKHGINCAEKLSTKKTGDLNEDDIFYDAQQIIYSPSTESVETQVYEGDLPEHIFTQEDNLGGSYRRELSFDQGASNQDITDPFETLGCNVSQTTDIENGLSHGLMKVEMFPEDIISCRKCPTPSTSGSCYKKTLMFEPPPILVLHIDRFKKNNRRGLAKRNDTVTYPSTLNLSPFCSIGLKVYQTDIQTRLSYSLYGVVAHSGTMNGGHYVAYIKTSGRSNTLWYDEIIGKYFDAPEKRKKDIESFLEGHQILPEVTGTDNAPNWFCVSDECIQECCEQDAINNPDAYVLLYEDYNIFLY